VLFEKIYFWTKPHSDQIWRYFVFWEKLSYYFKRWGLHFDILKKQDYIILGKLKTHVACFNLPSIDFFSEEYVQNKLLHWSIPLFHLCTLGLFTRKHELRTLCYCLLWAIFLLHKFLSYIFFPVYILCIGFGKKRNGLCRYFSGDFFNKSSRHIWSYGHPYDFWISTYLKV
jgi:hypothetical protein